MTKKKLVGITAAMFLGTSSFAYAQTAPTPQAPTTAQTTQPGAATAQPTRMRELTQDDVIRRLEQAGYSDINLEADGQHLTGTARRYGEDVDMRVMARTGRVIEPADLTQDQIRYRLEERGYTEIGEFEEENGEFRTTAQRFGEEMDLRLDRRTGAVRDPRDLTHEQIVTMLEGDDYENVVVFEREEEYGNFYVTAERDDEHVLLTISPITGDVMTERVAN